MKVLGGPPHDGSQHMNFHLFADPCRILTGAHLLQLVHNSREGNQDLVLHVSLHDNALGIFTKIIRPLRAPHLSSLIGMSVGHNSSNIGTTQVSSARRQVTTRPHTTTEQVEVETVQSIDDGTAPHFVPMRTEPHCQVLSISQAHSGTSEHCTSGQCLSTDQFATPD
jgi:hypothetical protein